MSARRLSALLCVVLTPFAVLAEIPVGGRVLANGAPLPEARVALLAPLDPDAQARADLAGTAAEPAAGAVSDAAGRFRLAAPGPGIWRVRIEAPGFVPQERLLSPLLEALELPDAEMPRDAGVTVKVGRPGAFVRADTQPTRADRFLGGAGWKNGTRRAVTGAEGSAVLPRAEDETLVLGASANGVGAVVREHVRGAAVTVALPAGPGRAIALTDGARKPAAGALLVTDTLSLPLGAAGPDGTLRVNLAGPLDVRALGTGGATTSATLRPAAAPADPPQAIAIEPAVEITGRVIDRESRRAIAGAVTWLDELPYTAATTDARGGFTLRLPATVRGEIQSAAAGYLPGALERPENRKASIALAPAAAIEGIVVDDAGRPLAGASVNLGRKPEPGRGGRMMIRIGGGGDPMQGPATRSGADGRFRIAPVDPAVSFELRAKLAGRAPATIDVGELQPYRTRRDLRVTLGAGRALTGRVIDAEGRPVTDATIEVRRSAPSGGGGPRMMVFGALMPPAATEYADREGRFRIADLAAGSYDLEASKEGFAKRKVPGFAIAEDAPSADAGDLVLEPGVAVEGFVHDKDGQPIEGVGVRAAQPGPGAFLPPGLAAERPDTVTGPDGWFRLGGFRAGESVDVTLARRGYVSEQRRGVTLPATAPLDVELRPSSVVTGRVVDPEGRPVARAEVTMSLQRASGAGQMSFAFRVNEGTTAGADGAFRFEEVQPGRISLAATASGWQEATIEGIEVKAGEDVLDQELRLVPGAWVEGQVVGPDGRPAIGAEVSRVTAGGDFRGGGDATTDGDGWYRIDGLTPGTVSIEATFESLPRVVKDVELKGGSNRLDLAFAGGVTVSGRVVDDAGAPLAGASVALHPAGQFWGGAETTTGADGTFRIAGVGEGSYGVFGARDGYAASSGDQRVEVKTAPVENVVVKLVPAARITGQVAGLDPADFGNVIVEAWQTNRFSRTTAPVDHQGKFTLEGVDEGTWSLTGRIGTSGRQAKADVTLAAGQREAQVTLEFGRGVVLSGIATQAGRPLAGAMVNARGEDVTSNGWSRTDDAGAFKIEGLESGRYAVDLRQWETGVSYATKVELATSREIELDVPAAELAGSVSDAIDSAPLAGVSVTLLDAAQQDGPSRFGRLAGVSDQHGQFTIASVPDGTYTLTTRKEGYAALTRTVTVQGGRALGELDLKLDATEGLTLFVRDQGGRAPDEALVAVLDGAGRAVSSSRYSTGENGRVRLATVAPGSWTVLVAAGGSATRALGVTVPGAALQVALPPATRLRVRVPDLATTPSVATVRVAGADGAPYRGLMGWGTPVSEWRISNGEASLDSLPPGPWTVTVTAADGRSWSGAATTTTAATAEVVL